MPKVPAHLVFQKIDILKRFHPEHVDGGPGQPGPVLSRSLRNYLISTVLRDMAGLVRNAGLAEDIRTLAHRMAERAVSGMLAGWDNDDICPPWRHPLPGPHPWWAEAGLVDQGAFSWLNDAPRGALDAVIAHGVRTLATLAGDAATGRALDIQAERLAAAA